MLSDECLHEPVVAHFTTELRGVASQEYVLSYNIWVIRRVVDWYAGLPDEQRR